jgi:hypothetical protein
VCGSLFGGVRMPRVASSGRSPSASIHRKKWRTPANQPRAVLGEVFSRRCTSQPRTWLRSASTGPTPAAWADIHAAKLPRACRYAARVFFE